MVNFVFGRGRKSNKQRIKVAKNSTVFLIHRTMGLVDDDEVKMPHTEAALTIRSVINQAHHGRISGNEDTAFRALLGHQIYWSRVWEVLLESPHRLLD